MSLYMLNKTCIEKMDKHRRRFFQDGKKRRAVIIWRSGLKFVGLRVKEACELKTSGNKPLVSCVNGRRNLRSGRIYGKEL
jgi:hypothetical protein